MKRPGETYFHTIKLFADLPIVPSLNGVKEPLLIALGVRRTIELSMIFDRLIGNGKWSTHDVILYLTAVRKEIPEEDMQRLKTMTFANSEDSQERHIIGDLYEPDDTLRSLQLPILQWPSGKWRSTSGEADFLYTLGLQRFPKVDVVLMLAANVGDRARAEKALHYFLTHFYIYGTTYNANAVPFAFIPTESGKLVKPEEVFTDRAAQLFGFEILRKDLHKQATILGVQQQAPYDVLLRMLTTHPPKSYATAQAQFEAIAFLRPSISKQDYDIISQRDFIPIEEKGKPVRLVSPLKCFFKDTSLDSLYENVFDLVDFGQQANQFLQIVGVRDEPSVTQIAEMLVNNPYNILRVCGCEEKYSNLLLQIAKSWSVVKKDHKVFAAMKSANMLIGHKYLTLSSNSDNMTGLSEDHSDTGNSETRQTSLQKASDVLLVDNIVDFNLFKYEVFTCPQNTALEELYSLLGSVKLSSTILDRPVATGPKIMNEMTNKLKENLIERLSVMLSDKTLGQMSDSHRSLADLQVCTQETITLRRTLRFGNVTRTKSMQTTALITSENTLCVTRNPDLYDISSAICRLVLINPTPGNFLLLESMMSNSLRTLKARGYDVDRILQKQEQIRKELKLKKDAEESQSTPGLQDVSKVTPTNDSQQASPDIVLDDLKQQPQISRQSSGMFSTMKRALGIKKNEQLQTGPSTPILQGNKEHAAGLAGTVADSLTRPAAERPSTFPISRNAIKQSGGEIQARPPPVQSVTSQAAIDSALQKAIRTTRSSDDRSIFTLPGINVVNEATSFCDTTPAQDLLLAATLQNKCKVFVHRNLNSSLIVNDNLAAAVQFSTLLYALGHVYGMNPGSLNLFYDNSSPVIAFNKAGTIYCNLYFYISLHSSSPVQVPEEDKRFEAYTYWFVTLAHELAHNLVAEHSSEHEFYTESMIISYLSKLLQIIPRHGGAITGSSTAPPSYSRA